MHELILRNAEGHDLARQPMQPHERYAFYQIWLNGDCFEIQGKRYRAVSVGWRIPEEDFVCCVTEVPKERMACGCEVGCCGCC